jgi:hypothetical protein
MTKVNRAYPHLLGGVSQEPSERRGAGEHWEQVNLLSDPVRGLTRRAGAQLLASQVIDDSDVTSGLEGADTRTYDFQVGENYLSVVYPTSPGRMGQLLVFNKTNGSIVPVTTQANGDVVDLMSGGVLSCTSLGRFVVFAGPGLEPTYTTTERYGVESNLQHHIIWIRGGAYSRTYRIALVRGNQKLWVEYTTPAASYPDPLDTSGLNVNDPDYLKQVNDLTNQYNSAVNAWIASALEAAQPENIARTLAEEITNSGFLGVGETAEATGANIYLLAPSVEDVEVEDGGDGSLARGVGNTVAAAELLSLFHYPGKIVRVRPNNSTNGQCFYMQAVPKDGSTGAVTEVSWRETAGTRFTPTVVFGVLAVTNDGDVAHFGTDLDTLRTASADFSGLPAYSPSDAGDADSNPPLRFLGESPTGLTTFQDRLVVLCNNSVGTSRTSDYFNFFRSSIVTVTADDPVSFVTIGGEDDILRYALTYDRNLILWGTQQYIVDGRKPFTPTTVSSVRMASIKDALSVPPTLAGTFMFYGRTRDDGSGTINHLQPGRIQEAPETHDLSRRLKNYIAGAPQEISVGQDPDFLAVRSREANDLKLYYYQDAANGERVLSAWFRWTFDNAAGQLLGVSVLNGAVYLLFGIVNESEEGNTIQTYLGRVSQQASGVPYLDLWQAADSGTVPTPELEAALLWAGGASLSYVGSAATTDGDYYRGLPMDAYVTLTSPFATDRDGLPILNARTVVNTVKVYTDDTSGLQWAVRVNGQCLGQGAWLVPQGAVQCPVGEEITILHEAFDTDILDRLPAPITTGITPWTGFMFEDEISPFEAEWEESTGDVVCSQFTLTFLGATLGLFGDTQGVTVGFVGIAGVVEILRDSGLNGSAWTLQDLPVGIDSADLTLDGDGFSVVITPTVPVAILEVGLYAELANPTSDWELTLTGATAVAEIPVPAAIWGASRLTASNAYLSNLNGVDPYGTSFVNGQMRAYNETEDLTSVPALPPFPHATAIIPVGRETRDYRLTLQSYLWTPLTIKAVEWVGQLLYRNRRL